jgi:hypothetical protein
MPGNSWFGNVALEEAYVPVTYSSLTDQYASYLSSFARSLPTPSNQSSLVMQSNNLPSDQISAFQNISTALLLPGNLDPNSIQNLPPSKRIIYAFDAEVSLRPATGYWNHSLNLFPGQSRPVDVTQGGSGSIQLVASYDGFYTIAVDLHTTGAFQISVDNKLLAATAIGNSAGSDWFETPSLYLLRGTHQINLVFDGEQTAIDQILVVYHLTTSDESFGTILNGHASVIETAKTGIASFTATIESSSPFLVVFGESYDPRWVAVVRKSIPEHFMALGWANGFYVKSAENTSLHIVYTGQQSWEIELIIAGTAWVLLFCALFLQYLQTRRRWDPPRRQEHKSTS